jgi:hypothetical protein
MKSWVCITSRAFHNPNPGIVTIVPMSPQDFNSNPC